MSHSFLTLHDLPTDRQQGRAGGAGGGGGGVKSAVIRDGVAVLNAHLLCFRTAHGEQWPAPGSISSGQTNECGGSE